MTTMFRDERAKTTVEGWYDRFRARLPPTESRTVKTRAGDTHVLVGGPEGAPSVVMLHGALASSAHVLRELAPLLGHFRVYAVDVVGQSVKSADARPSVTNNEYGEWLADVLDALSLPRALIVGVSWGGFVAIRLAAHAPERIGKLVLLVPAGVVSGPAWAGFAKMGLPLLVYRLFPSERARDRLLRHLMTSTDDDWATYLGDAFRAYSLDIRVPALARPEELARLTAPTMVVAADQDLSFPGKALLARARTLFPSLVEEELLADCRHCPPTNDAFRAWLSGRVADFLLAAT